MAFVTMLIGVSDADDVVADTFTVALRRVTEIPVGAELAWLLAVSRRLVANRRRGDRRAQSMLDHVRVLRARHAATVPDVAGSVVEREALVSALMQLGAVDRELVVRAVWFGEPPARIAARLSISPNAATVRIHRARRRLAELLDEDDGPPSGRRAR